MKNYIKKRRVQEELISITCDCCKKEYPTTPDIEFETEEFLSLQKIAGYVSIFGDGNIIELDMCQHCVKKILGKYLRIEERNI